MIMGNQNHIYSLDSFLDIDLLNSLKYSPMSIKSFTVSCWLYAFYHLFFPQPQGCCQCQYSVPHYGYTTYGRKFSSLSMMCTMSFKTSLTMLISPTERVVSPCCNSGWSWSLMYPRTAQRDCEFHPQNACSPGDRLLLNDTAHKDTIIYRTIPSSYLYTFVSGLFTQKKTSFFSTLKDNAKTSFGTDTVLRIPYIKLSTILPFFSKGVGMVDKPTGFGISVCIPCFPSAARLFDLWNEPYISWS